MTDVHSRVARAFLDEGSREGSSRMYPPADLTFVHLSDIHFRKGFTGTKNDPDLELREQLDADLRKLVPQFGKISGVIITGDVAFSGHKSEYRQALAWITNMAEHMQCPLSNVMVIPGNHDVSRSEILKDDKRILKLQRKVRRGGDAALSVARLATVLNGKEGKLLAAPVKTYNRFAKQFACNITPLDPYWERPFSLGDGTRVLLRGLTSTWLSGPEDSEQVIRLLYGSAQYEFTKIDHTYYVVAAHHPPQSMIDGVPAARAFDFHCRLQLFGHKHEQWVTSTKTCTRIAAGAVQPDRREKLWTPRYNILQISGEFVADAQRVVIRIYPRKWSEEFRTFIADFTPDAKDVREYEFAS